MNKQIKQIAERLKGLRDSLDLSYEEMADRCGKDPYEIELYESGDADIPMSYLFDVAQHLKIDTSTLLSGDEPKMSAYFVTRKGKGVSVERTKAYKYQALAAGFSKCKANPFMVTVHPKPDDEPVYQNTHDGQEYNYVISGRMLLQINGKDIVLEEGDSIYFDALQPHGMKALDGQTVQFLAIII
ncbi:MAG: cupin domain-containing protein [Dysgonamonadaceae bacterium]|jgi:transcriptional regulator with XRE-family HTH domain|nr:cupin domain-containing protein [Dysgonamonadaceae bacterium]